MSIRTHRNTNSVPKRIFKKLLKLILFLILPVLLFEFAFRLNHITVTGSTRYTPEQIKQKLIKNEFEANTLYLYLKYHYFTDAKIPFVEKIDMKMAGRNSINVRVYEKIITGCVEFMGEYLYFDKDGIIVESSEKRLEGIPLIKGLKFNSIILNEKLKVQKNELFDVILNLTQQIKKYELNVNAIIFNSDYEVTLDCGDIRALLGKRSTYDEVIYELKNMIDASKGMKLEIDLKNYDEDTGNVVAKPLNPTD